MSEREEAERLVSVLFEEFDGYFETEWEEILRAHFLMIVCLVVEKIIQKSFEGKLEENIYL